MIEAALQKLRDYRDTCTAARTHFAIEYNLDGHSADMRQNVRNMEELVEILEWIGGLLIGLERASKLLSLLPKSRE